jgi:hypothetical protein
MESALSRNYSDMLVAIKICLDKGLHMPSLTLIFSLIDSFAWAASDKQPSSNRIRFEEWVSKWLLTQKILGITATDLYAARCGILHALTSESDLSKKAAARRIAYAWGDGDEEVLRIVLDEFGGNDIASIHMEDLFEALRLAINAMLLSAEQDAILASRLEEASGKLYTYIPTRRSPGNNESSNKSLQLDAAKPHG